MDYTCCHPRYVKVPVYDEGKWYTKKYTYMKAPCGKCWYCLMRAQQEWQAKLLAETQYHGYGYYVTLTYDDEHLKSLNKKEIQRFLHSLRVWYHRNVDENAVITYFCVGEYGRKENRPHYHLQIFGLKNQPLRHVLALMQRFWNNGFCYVKRTAMWNVSYVTKYMKKLDPRKHDVEPFTMFSKRPSLGKRFMDQQMIDHINNLAQSDLPLVLTFRNGSHYRLPRIFKRKFLTKESMKHLQSVAAELAASYLFDDVREMDLQQRAREKYSDEMLEKCKQKFYES